ncbi:phosphoribosylglycinamide synthetase [Pacificimonas sp. WHA3]|uniref:Phosphoribosylglycinamide synthetase n=2 Tax=Pacificimonas pallii TaxID=2827236 RepID=A0ABS6SEV5_9SPHN|nr:phosphoribosylglycinamide synthetase [Pacificimonas pallii]
MFIAKHALGDGTPHPTDGTHATYHHEIRTVLEDIGLNLVLADRYQSLFDRPDVDFVFPLLNRGGFLNSEMLLPLLCNRHSIPYLGASPIIRGMSDDKHLTKMAARDAGVPTLDWAIFRRGAPMEEAKMPKGERFVIKPNASSASWGVSDATDWPGVQAAVAKIHGEGHDAIVERFLSGHDIEVSVITMNGKPIILPTQMNVQADPTILRTYEEKRNLSDGPQRYKMVPYDDPEWLPQIYEYTYKLLPEYLPFDYGRWEFRLDPESGTLMFLEVNLNCNLWSKKTISISAGLAGMSHAELIETILAESLSRNGLLP